MTDFRDYTETKNSWVKTGEPVTYDDVLDYEKQLHEIGVVKREKREAKKELSATEAAHRLKQEWLRYVYDEIEALKQIERDKHKGVTKKEWFEQWEKLNSWEMADTGISVMYDATERKWSKRNTEENIGKALGTMVFGATMNYNAKARRKLERLEVKVAKLEGYDGPGRTERILQFADEYGFQSDKWQNDRTYQSKHGHPLMECVLKALPDVFDKVKDKREGDTHLRYYIVLTEKGKLGLEDRNNALNQFSSFLGPMIMPPRKWSKDNMTPYARNEMFLMTPLVRHMGEEQKQAIQDGLRDNSLNRVLGALNAIQETAYQVNKYVHDAIIWVQSHMDVVSGHNLIGRQIAGYPNTKHVKSKPGERLEPSEFKKLPKKEQIILARKASDKARHNLSAKQARESFTRILDQSAKIQRFLKFWLPHNLDYRGRVYHIPDFGHHNIDWIRALFMFANKTEVTPDCEKYLKRQIANTAGQDKETLAAREKWVDDNEDKIIAAGRDFKKTFEWWGGSTGEVKGGSSFQFLAACRDWAQYKEAQEFGEPYKSGLPCASDATQSGVQHYAAALLAKDVAEKVNLRKSDVPADFYTLCLNRAIELIRKDREIKSALYDEDPITREEKAKIDEFEAEIHDLSRQEYPDLDERKQDEQRAKDIAKANKAFAKTKVYEKQTRLKDIHTANVALELYEKGQYNRNHIKRNAMTFCYSSEEYGFAQQLDSDWMNKLTADVFDKKISVHPFGDDDGFYAARYLAKIHYAAISREVSAAAIGMRFFQDCAAILAADIPKTQDDTKKKVKGIGKHVRFKNRLHFPMIQDYRDNDTHQHKVLGRDKSTGEWNPNTKTYYKRYKETVNVDRTCNGIAPNVIHQQDSLHLMMTVEDCVAQGVTNFMMIHDSFATTAGEAARLREATKVAFVALYQDYNLCQDFLNQCKARHSDASSVDWPEVPKQGDLDILDVFESDYFFS